MIGPIAHFSFIMKSAKKLFYARTFDPTIFKECDTCTYSKLFDSGLLSHSEITEIKSHKNINIDRNKIYKLYCI